MMQALLEYPYDEVSQANVRCLQCFDEKFINLDLQAKPASDKVSHLRISNM